MSNRTEIVAIIAGTLMVAGGVALELAGKAPPPEIWIAGTAALSGGLGLAVPSSSSSSSVLATLARDFSDVAGILKDKAAPAASSQSVPEATQPFAKGGGVPAESAKADSPSAPAVPVPATLTTTATVGPAS